MKKSLSLLCILLALALSACGGGRIQQSGNTSHSDDSVLENAGEVIEEGVENAKDGMDRAKDTLTGRAGKTGTQQSREIVN